MKSVTALMLVGLVSVQAVTFREHTLLQLRDDNQYYQAGDQGMTPNGIEYVRQFPEMFNEETEEKFMRTVIDQYALEKKNDKGQPSGKFYMNEKLSKELAQEVVRRAKKLEGKELEEYTKQYFTRTWKHFDVNDTGMLDAMDMTAFCKYFASDQSVDLDALFKN